MNIMPPVGLVLASEAIDAFGHLVLRIPGEVDVFPTAWRYVFE
nr:hypothetical protein [Mesorhizobium onobrychidis]